MHSQVLYRVWRVVRVWFIVKRIQQHIHVPFYIHVYISYIYVRVSVLFR
jgi:hypothetical protein